MTIKRLFMILFVLLFGFSTFILFRGTNVLPNSDKLKPKSPEGPVSKLDKAARVQLHPLASDWETIEAAKKQRVTSFDDWARKTVEIGLALDVLYGIINTPEELAAAREKKLAIQMEWAASIESQGCSLPKYPYEWPKLPPEKLFDYNGPQTSPALIKEFDQSWMERYPQSVDWDIHYPKAAWIDRIVSMGGKFQEVRDYSFYLKLRRDLIKHKEEPDKWIAGSFGILPTTNFEEYESAYIQRKIWENQIRKKVRADYPDEPRISTYFPSSQPDKYLPVVGNMTYVYRRPNSSIMKTYGKLLTQEETKKLRNKGIEPEGIEIIYIDDEFNILTEKPKPYNHQEWLAKNSYDIVPEGLRAPDGTIVSPERYQEITGKEMPDETKQKYSDYIGTPSPAEVFARAEAAREAVRTREVARAEFERFQNEMQQTEKFQSIAASEMSRELATQFLSKHSLKQGTSKQLENALELMFQHGFEEGFRRVRQDSPSIADQLERYLSETQRPLEPQKKPQRPTPSNSPESAPPETEAP